MINILLLLITIAGLGGMVFCNHKQKKGSKYQLIALGLLVLVLVSGGLFMRRIDTLSLLGLKVDAVPEAIEHKFDDARALKTVEFIAKTSPAQGKVLVVVTGRNRNYSASLHKYLELKKFTPNLEMVQQNGSDVKTNAAEIENALTKHKNLRAVVFAGFNDPAVLEKLSLYKLPLEKRPLIIIAGEKNLTPALYERMNDGLLNAAILVDMTKTAPSKLPEDLNELFNCRYIFIDKSNLENNKIFFSN
jgi:hypothetical protein